VNTVYVIADPKLARLILEGDETKGLRSAEKSNDYAIFDYVTTGTEFEMIHRRMQIESMLIAWNPV
jgi:hypothetical protein